MVVLFLGLSSSVNIEPNAADTNSPDNGRHEQAIGLLRAINTAELNYQIKHGVYATWDSLVSNGDFTTSGSQWISQDSQYPTLKFSNDSEILPGWVLRLNVAADGKAYDLLLQDTTDVKCGYAAITDERGVIRQGKTIDCKL
jgi:hypothetical protein